MTATIFQGTWYHLPHTLQCQYKTDHYTTDISTRESEKLKDAPQRCAVVRGLCYLVKKDGK